MIQVTEQAVLVINILCRSRGHLKVNNVMCCLSIRFSDMFNPNPPSYFGQNSANSEKTHSNKKTFTEFDFEPKGQGHSKNQKTMTFGTKKHSDQNIYEHGVPS